MSGAMPFDPGAGRKVVAAADQRLSGSGTADNIARMGMSPRQQELNRWWSLYCCAQYASYRFDWNGKPVQDPFTDEVIASGNLTPPGFYDAAGTNMPLKWRKPTAPYNLGRVMVNRFTGLLFSQRSHPKIRVDGDKDTEDFVTALAETSRIWAHMITARTFGGATGTVAMGFQFVDGVPRVEVHDPRWLDPVFEDRDRLILSSIEKRYQYPVERRNPDTGQWETIPFWYRRVIDKEQDVVFKPAPVGNGEEPKWEIATRVEHGLGFCPVVWIQNTPVLDDIDGDPDCHGVEDLLRAIDTLLAQANYGTVANSDPTLVISSELALSQISKGSDNAIKLGPEGKASYLELQGVGAKAAIELADKFRACALEVAQCVLDQPNQAGPTTATEIERRYSAMIERADILREQYGERGVKPLLEMMVKAARMLQRPKIVDGRQVIEVLNLPKRIKSDPNDASRVEQADRKLGPGGNLLLQWPRYFVPSAADLLQAVQAAVAAKTASLVDAEHAAAFVADGFGVEDVAGMMHKLDQQAATQQADMERMTLSGSMPPASPPIAPVSPQRPRAVPKHEDEEVA